MILKRCRALISLTAIWTISNDCRKRALTFRTSRAIPTRLQHKHIQASYYAMIEFLDDEFGRLLDYLDETGQRENTIIIFMSDHGETLGDHGLGAQGLSLL